MGSSCLAGTLKIFSETTNSNVLLVFTNNVCYVLYKLHIYIYVDKKIIYFQERKKKSAEDLAGMQDSIQNIKVKMVEVCHVFLLVQASNGFD